MEGGRERECGRETEDNSVEKAQRQRNTRDKKTESCTTMQGYREAEKLGYGDADMERQTDGKTDILCDSDGEREAERQLTRKQRVTQKLEGQIFSVNDREKQLKRQRDREKGDKDRQTVVQQYREHRDTEMQRYRDDDIERW